MADSQANGTSLSVSASKSDQHKGTNGPRDGASKRRLQCGKSPTCTVTRSKCTNLESISKKMEPTPSQLYSKPSSIILRIKQHPLSLEVHLPEESFPSSSTTDSSDSDNSHGGATQSSSTVEKRSFDEDSDAESTYNARGAIDSFAELENAHASENRTILIHRMAEVLHFLDILVIPGGFQFLTFSITRRTRDECENSRLEAFLEMYPSGDFCVCVEISR